MAVTSGIAKPSVIHGSVTLKDFVVGALQDSENYIGDKVFGTFDYHQRSAEYFKWSPKTDNRRNMAVRTALEESVGMIMMNETATYTVPVKAVHIDLPRQEVKDEHEALSMEESAGSELADQVRLEREMDLQELLADAGWGFTYTGGIPADVGTTADFVEWDDFANSTPIRDVATLVNLIHRKTGKRPNTGVFARDVHTELMNHPDIVERLHMGGNTGVAIAQDADLARLFQLKDFYVGDAIINVGDNTDPDPANWVQEGNFIFERCGWIGYVAPVKKRYVRTAAMMFTWSNYVESEAGMTATIEAVNLKKVERYEVETAHQYEIVDPSLGARLVTVISDIYA